MMSRPTLTFRTAATGRIVAELGVGVPAGEILEGVFGADHRAVFWLQLPLAGHAHTQYPAMDMAAAKRLLRLRVSEWFAHIGVLGEAERVRCDDPAMREDVRARRLDRFDDMLAGTVGRKRVP